MVALHEYQDRLCITRNGRKDDNGLKKILCDSVHPKIEKIVKKAYKEYKHLESENKDDLFYRIQAFNEELFRHLPFLGCQNYEAYIMEENEELMNAFWDRTKSPTLLSDLTKEKMLDCAAQAYAILLSIPEDGWHPFVRIQKVHESNYVEKSHVVLGKRYNKRVAVLDPSLGSLMVESQQRKFLLPSNHVFTSFHMPVKSLPYS